MTHKIRNFPFSASQLAISLAVCENVIMNSCGANISTSQWCFSAIWKRHASGCLRTVITKLNERICIC
ncbi:hypothetical protein SUGI_0737750 [Cryptomeria japonica]|nr:hypothetical protein SUGI_0737750 [Cryptomeria japonica]